MKRTKTYSLEDVTIVLLQEMSQLKSKFTQSGIIDALVLNKARDLCRSRSQKYHNIRRMIKGLDQQGDLFL